MELFELYYCGSDIVSLDNVLSLGNLSPFDVLLQYILLVSDPGHMFVRFMTEGYYGEFCIVFATNHWVGGSMTKDRGQT